MFGADALTFREFVMRERLPLAMIQKAVLEFLRGRDDAVVFGAQAVNAYVGQPRMTQDIDLLSARAEGLAGELRDYLRRRFRIAVRVRRIGEGRGYRVYQVQKAGSRHLVDVRSVEMLPLARRIANVLVMAPEELIASKIIAYHHRRGKPKSGSDWRDLAMLFLRFPALKRATGPVVDRLQAAGADRAVLRTWKVLVAQEVRPEEEDDEF